MKRHGMAAWLLPLSVLLLATLIQGTTMRVMKTAEVEHHKTTSTSMKPETTVSVTPGSNHPEVITDDVIKMEDEVTADDDKARLATKEERLKSILSKDEEKSLIDDLPQLAQPVVNPSNVLYDEIERLNKDLNDGPDQKIQKEVEKIIKKQAQKVRPDQEVNPAAATNLVTSSSTSKSTTHAESRAMKELLQAESDVMYADELDGDDDDDDDDDNYDDEDEDDEEIMTQCPDYCRCAGQYGAVTTAKCSKLIDKQSFGVSIAHLTIENAGEIRLGPHELRSRGLDHLETITIVNTRISAIDRTAFDGVTFLFAVNLTQNGILDIHHDTFRNSSVNLLTISGHPFVPNWLEKVDYLFDAPSVKELDFSRNLFEYLPINAFSKMSNLEFLSLKGNKLSTINKVTFAPLDALVELDLSDNLLVNLPLDIFEGKDLQSLKIVHNFLNSLATVKSMELNILDASYNQIKIIAKDDLINLPALEELTIRWNGLKRIHQHAFSSLSSLNHLDISNNKLTLLTEHHLRNNPGLKVLLMNDNPDLGSLPVFKAHGSEYNSYSVFRFECANCGLGLLKNGTFNAMPALTDLNLARNRLTALPKGLFEPLSALRKLDLSDNLISSISNNMLVGAVSLISLNLAGNPLTTLQMTPFLQAGELNRLDVSRCQLRRVWSEARQPLKSLRYLSVRGNELERITVEELKATPKLAGLDLSRNPLVCDDEFNDAVQWLMSHGVTPKETLEYMSVLEDTDNFGETDEITQWSDLAKLTCEGELGGPPARPLPRKPPTTPAEPDDEDAADISKDDLENDLFNPRINLIDHGPRIDEAAEDAWLKLDTNVEYEDMYSVNERVYHWYNSRPIWPVLTVILVVLSVLIIIIQFAKRLIQRKGRSPVIRPPLILRQGLVDNKNCGLVYKPLQEEIATPHMPKRGSFYSSSTFHYDKIVPESV